MARPLFGHSVAEAGAEADPGDQAVGRASSNFQPSVFQHTTVGPRGQTEISFAVFSSAFVFHSLLHNVQFLLRTVLLLFFIPRLVPLFFCHSNPCIRVTVICWLSKIGR